MRKTLTIISILTISVLVNGTVSLDSLFLQANEAYSSGDYELAFTSYMQIQEQGFESTELYYNMGNAAFKSNKLGYSILFYEKALKLNPSYEDAEKNLKYVSIYKEDQLEEVPEFFLKTWVHALYSLFSLSVWSYISMLLFTLAYLGILVYIFARSLVFKKIGFFSGIISILFFALSFSATVNSNSYLKNPENAVIIAPSVVVKSSPSHSGTDLFVLHEGTFIMIDEEVGEWIEIKISDGRVGWIHIEALHLI